MWRFEQAFVRRDSPGTRRVAARVWDRWSPRVPAHQIPGMSHPQFCFRKQRDIKIGAPGWYVWFPADRAGIGGESLFGI
jgi:hypothetical protein